MPIRKRLQALARVSTRRKKKEPWLTTLQTLVARGEHPRQSGAGGSSAANPATASPPYDNSGSHGVLGGGMEPNEAASEFTFGSSSHGAGGGSGGGGGGGEY